MKHGIATLAALLTISVCSTSACSDEEIAPGAGDIASSPGTSASVQSRSQAPSEETPQERSDRPPTTAEDLWMRILVLINEHDGYVTKDRVEEVLRIRFMYTTGHKDYEHYVVYRLNVEHQGYFNTTVGDYTDQYKALGESELSGAQSSWSVGWPADGPSDHSQSECITAGRARSDLSNKGWVTSSNWGSYEAEQPTTQPAGCNQAVGCGPHLQSFTGSAYFHRDAGNGLPELRVMSAGGTSKACVSSIAVNARP